MKKEIKKFFGWKNVRDLLIAAVMAYALWMIMTAVITIENLARG